MPAACRRGLPVIHHLTELAAHLTRMSDIEIRDLTTIDEFRQVVELEQAIWGYTDQGDLVTVPVFIFTVQTRRAR